MFVPELHRDLSWGEHFWLYWECRGRGEGRGLYLVISKSKQFLPQPIPILLGPFLRQERDDLVVAAEERVAVAPDGVWGVAIFDFGGISIGGC